MLEFYEILDLSSPNIRQKYLYYTLIVSRWQANELGNKVGKNDLKKWQFETKPVFGHEKAGNQRK